MSYSVKKHSSLEKIKNFEHNNLVTNAWLSGLNVYMNHLNNNIQ